MQERVNYVLDNIVKKKLTAKLHAIISRGIHLIIGIHSYVLQEF